MATPPDDSPVAVFTDPDIEPTDTRIAAALGPAEPAWRLLSSQLGDLGLVLSWQYYRDGGWLCRALKGKKNIVWLAIWDGHATAACYFPERLRAEVETLEVSGDLMARIAASAPVGKSLPVQVQVRTAADVDDVLAVAKYKMVAK